MDDPIGKALTEVLYNIENSLDAHGWDQPPVLLAVWRDGPAWIEGAEGGFDAMTLEVRAVPVPPELWAICDRPVQVIEYLADTYAEAQASDRPTAGDGLMAYVFACEAWLVRHPDSETFARSERRELSQDPNRIEVRFLSAVDSAGQHYFVCHERDGIVYDMDSDEASALTGAVPAALTKLLEVTL